MTEPAEGVAGRPGRVDVVVVGGGSAGAVLAARLSEDPVRTVLLLEAGPDDAVPRGASFAEAAATPGRQWGGLTATFTAGRDAQPYLRGRGIGGSSAINAMVALRGEPEDYDEWERDLGCDGWGWSHVHPWFARTNLALNRAGREEWGAISSAFAVAAPDGATGVELTRDGDGTRVSVNDAYLQPARARPNLTIRGDAMVDSVLLDGRRAVGIRLVDGDELEADLVIVSAGAIHSPAILLRSGIDTPGIGANLHDHPSFPITIDRIAPADVGALAITTLASRSSPAAHHDLQLLPMEYVDPAAPDQGMLLNAVMRVFSRGSVRLASDDPAVDPIVELAMLSDERDWLALSAAIEMAERLLDHPAMRAVGSPREHDRSPAGARAALGHYFHAAGTCAIGTVVDPGCRVIGYQGLMVCDASVMPNLPRANPHLPTVMIAERIAAMTAALTSGPSRPRGR